MAQYQTILPPIHPPEYTDLYSRCLIHFTVLPILKSFHHFKTISFLLLLFFISITCNKNCIPWVEFFFEYLVFLSYLLISFFQIWITRSFRTFLTSSRLDMTTKQRNHKSSFAHTDVLLTDQSFLSRYEAIISITSICVAHQNSK